MLFSVQNHVHFSRIFAQVIADTIHVSAQHPHRTGHEHPFIVESEDCHIAFV
jgi:hypothetical protein